MFERREGGALASIVSAKGSLPMSRRSKMLVLSDGSQRGTVGGGCLEAEVHAMGRQAMKAGTPIVARFTLTEAKAGAEGLNCGGTVEILIEPLNGDDPATAEVFRQSLDAIRAGDETVMATALSGEIGQASAPGATGARGVLGQPGAERAVRAVRIGGKGLVGWKGLRIGVGVLSGDPTSVTGTSLVDFAIEESLSILGQDTAVFVNLPAEEPSGPVGLDGPWLPGGSCEARLFLETLNAPPTLYLFGGGHVSLAVARVARTAGFRVIVVDDRPAFASADRFPEADRTLVLPLESAMAQLPVDRSSYIVAVTRGHQHDEPVIEQAIRTPAAYIGMIGSRRKVALMQRRLLERGATQDQLDRVHAPIGLPIGADSPGEIAVSIVAQMIEVRRQRKQTPDRPRRGKS